MAMRLSAVVGSVLIVGVIVATARVAEAQVLVENFDEGSINPALWVVTVLGTGPQLAAANQQLEVTIPQDAGGTDFGAILASRFRLRGDFDVQVGFRLLTWPLGNGVRMGLGTDTGALLPHPGVERISFGQSDYPGAPRESYLTDFPDGVGGITATDDVVGALRLVRHGATQTGYYLNGDVWETIHTGPAPTADIGIRLATWSGYQFRHWNVVAAWDELVINSGEITGVVADQGDAWGGVQALFR